MNNIVSFLSDSAALSPDKTYVVDRDRTWTYGELLESSRSLAGLLNGLGVAGGDRVLIYLDNSSDYIRAYFAALYLGAVVVPVNKNLTMDVVGFIAADAEPALVVTNAIFKKRLSELSGAGYRVLDVDSPNAGDGSGTPPSEAAETDVGSPALILYTSGTTRMPKGVVLTHGNLRANTESIVSYLGLGAEDSLLTIVNFGYSYGNSLLLTHTKASGTLVLENRTSYPVKIIEQLRASRVTGFSTVGSYLNILLKQEFLEPEHLTHLRYITFAGESTSFDDIDRLRGLAPHLKIFVMYGQTEASARLSYLKPDMLDAKRGSVGRGIPGVALRVVGEDGGDIAPGEVGEIIASGDNIMPGYWKNEAATREVIKDGWLHTGDLATVDKDGYITIKGRRDDMIKFMGHRISPVEIESAVNSFEGVLESAVVTVTEEGQTRIKAFVVPRSAPIDLDALVQHLKRMLPAFKNPQSYAVIDALPRTPSGKIRRSALKSGSTNP